MSVILEVQHVNFSEKYERAGFFGDNCIFYDFKVACLDLLGVFLNLYEVPSAQRSCASKSKSKSKSEVSPEATIWVVPQSGTGAAKSDLEWQLIG